MHATDDIRSAGQQDLVILAVKANQVEPIIDDVTALFHDDTVLIPMQNGIPWWYFQRHGGPYEGHCVRAVDPHARIMSAIDPRRIIGCVVYPAASIASPGVVKHIEGNRYPLGELDGTTTERITRIAQAFTAAGLKAPILDDIRAEIWLKLWGNLSFNPISALTHSTLVDLCQYPAHAHAGAGHDDRGAVDRAQARHRVPGDDREAHRRRGEGRQAQDVDAAGHRGGPRARDRRRCWVR